MENEKTPEIVDTTATELSKGMDPVTAARVKERTVLPSAISSFAEMMTSIHEIAAEADAIGAVDAGNLGRATELSKDIQNRSTALKKIKAKAKRPVIDLGKDIEAVFKLALAPLTAAATPLNQNIAGHIEDVNKQRLAEAKALEEENRRRAEEHAKAVEAARLKEEQEATARRLAAEALQAKEDAALQAAKDAAAELEAAEQRKLAVERATASLSFGDDDDDDEPETDCNDEIEERKRKIAEQEATAARAKAAREQLALDSFVAIPKPPPRSPAVLLPSTQAVRGTGVGVRYTYELDVTDAALVPTHVNGVEIRPIDAPAAIRILKTGAAIPGCQLRKTSHAVQRGR